MDSYTHTFPRTYSKLYSRLCSRQFGLYCMHILGLPRPVHYYIRATKSLQVIENDFPKHSKTSDWYLYVHSTRSLRQLSVCKLARVTATCIPHPSPYSSDAASGPVDMRDSLLPARSGS